MSYRQKYFQKNIAKKILHKDGDFFTAVLVNDISYGIAASDYRDFLYNDDGVTGEGFRDAFHGLRKSVIKKTIALHERISNDTKLSFKGERAEDSIRALNRREYWKHKNYLAEHSENIKYIDDDETPVRYVPEEDVDLHVHHLKSIKNHLNEEMTVGELLKVSDPKYSVAMTPEGHRTGEKIGHAGNNHNSPKIDDPYDSDLPSLPTEKYLLLKEKREELINYNIDDVSLSVGIISATLMLGVAALKKNGNLHDHLTKFKVQKGLFKVSAASFAIYSREYSKGMVHESETLQKFLFESRDSLIESQLVGDSISMSFGDIDIFADALSFVPFGFVIQAGRFGEDVFKNGFTKQAVYKHGSQFAIKSATFGGGNLILGSLMDPTGASLLIVISYAGVSYLIKWNKQKNQRLIIELQRNRTRYYIQRELTKL